MKMDEVVVRKADRGVREFIDQATIIFNYGKYSGQTLTSEPTWVARNGEFAFLQSSSQNRLYFYANNQWNWMAGSPTGGGVQPGGDNTQVQVNSMDQALYADSGFTYIANSAVTISRDMLVILNNNSGSNTYYLYRSSNTYMEFYINGELRLQM
jgi:hypothetical protein